jgi:DNA polymerase elongation subunit (family B)
MMESKFVQFPYEFTPALNSLPPRPPVDAKRYAELSEKAPALELFASEINVERVQWKCEIVIDARWMVPGVREPHTVTVRIPFRNYFFVRGLDHWGPTELKHFKKYLLETPEKKFYGQLELVSGQNLGKHLDMGKFVKIWHHGTSNSMQLAKHFRYPRDVSRCNHLLGLGDYEEFQFDVFEANVTPDKRFMIDTRISGGSWFTIAAESYVVVGPRPTEDVPFHRLTKRQVEIRLHTRDTRQPFPLPGRADIPPKRTLSFDGEMLSRALKFPNASNDEDGTIFLGNVVDRGLPDAPMETVVFTIANCRTDDAERRERNKPLTDSTRCPFYRYDAWPAISEIEFQKTLPPHLRQQPRDEEAAAEEADSGHTTEGLWAWRQLLSKKEPANDWHNMQAKIRSMLLGWAAFNDYVDPDVRIAYNGDAFDWPFLFGDATKLGLLAKGEHALWGPTHVVPTPVKTLAQGRPCFGEFSVFCDEVATCRRSFTKSAAKGAQISYNITARGHWDFDILKDVRDTYSLPSNSLNAVAEHFLGQRKLDVSIHSMMRACLDGFEHPNDPKIMKANEDSGLYCGKDALLPMLLMLQFLQTIVKLVEFARATDLNVRTIWQNGQQQRAFQGILVEAQPADAHPVRMMVPTKMPHKNDDRDLEVVQAQTEAADESESSSLGLVDSQDRVVVQMRSNHHHPAEEGQQEDEENDDDEDEVAGEEEEEMDGDVRMNPATTTPSDGKSGL